MAYSPEGEWIDLYLNGEYAGLYLLCEKNEIHPERVALPENEGILVSKDILDRFISKGNPYILTDAEVPLRIHSSTLVEKKVKDVFQSVENAILAEDGIDPVTGKHWSELIDVDSWVRKYLVEEIFGGVDAGRLSQFFYYTEGSGKVFAGPVWDYDAILRDGFQSSVGRITAIPQMMFAQRRYQIPWFHALCNDENFYAQVKACYRKEVRPKIACMVTEVIPRYTSEIEHAAKMNQVRWAEENFLDETADMLEKLAKRIEFLDSLWIEELKYQMVTVVYQDVIDSKIIRPFDYYVLSGECLPEELLSELLDDQSVIYDATTNEPFDISKPITSDIQLKAYASGYFDLLLFESGSSVRLQKKKIVNILSDVIFCVGLIMLAVMDYRRGRRTARKC